MRILPGLRHRIPLIVLLVGVVYLALDWWIEERIAMGAARESVMHNAARTAVHAMNSLASPRFAAATERGHLLEELAEQYPNLVFAAIVDSRGRLVECAPERFAGAPLDSMLRRPDNAVADTLARPGGVVATLLRDQQVIATSPPLAPGRGGVRFVCAFDARPRFAAITRDVRAQSLPGVTLGVALVLLLAWLLESWLHAPSQRLETAARWFALGDLGARSGLRGDDEIARAGAAFDRMADEVERTERELMAARAQLSTVLELLPVGVCVVTRADRRVLIANSRLRALMGLGEPGPERDAAFLQSSRVVEVDGTPAPPERRATARALATGEPASFGERFVVRPDGRRVSVLSSAVPVSLSGEPGYDAVVTVVHERDELQQLSEAVHLWKRRYERVVEATGQVVYDWDLVTGQNHSSGNRAAVLGFPVGAPADALRNWRERLHPDDFARTLRRLEECVESGEPFDAEYRLRHGDGRWVTIHDRGFFDRGPDGRPVRMFGLMADVTAQREVEAQLVQAQKMETIGTLAGGVAHDFNNQLTGVIGHLDLLHDALSPGDPSLDHLRVARAAAQRCADLTRGLLAFSRRIDSRIEPASLEALVEETVRLLRRALPVSVKLETDLASGLPPAHMDTGQMQQVLLNLCLNARDAMPGGGTIRVSTRDAGGGFLELGVSDTGPGIAPDVLPRIFEPFFTTKPVGQGTGLGLSMVYGTVSKHGGRIDVQSRPGEGAHFRVLLPAAEAGAAAPSAPAPAAAPAGGGACVLVVDDEAILRTLAERALGARGFRVRLAKDTVEAEAVLREPGHGVRVVLLDVMMPGRTGIEALPVLRALAPETGFVLTSGHTPAGGWSADADVAFLPKPFSPAALADAVQQALAAAGTRA